MQSIDFMREIPDYSDMSVKNKSRYQALYTQAVNPELLQLPEDISDLHALLYFIFQYNLSHVWSEKGELSRVIPFIPVQWTQVAGLSMISMTGPRYAPLLDKLAPLQSSIALYFSVLMVSLALTCAAMPDTKNYHLLMTLLLAMLDGNYDQATLNTLKAQSGDLNELWLVNYLPDPAVMTPVEDAKVQPVREYLLGGSTTRGMFPPPEKLMEDDRRPSATKGESSKKKGSCLIL